jgi:hypothetical protein
VRLVHAHSVRVARLACGGQAPLQASNNKDGKEKAEGPGQEGPSDARPGDGGSGRALARHVFCGGWDVPEGLYDGSAREEQKEGNAEVGRAEDVERRAALDGRVRLRWRERVSGWRGPTAL